MPEIQHPFIHRSARAAAVREDRPDLRVLNAGGETAEIYLYDEIGPWGITANAFREQIEVITAPHINLRINSIGGDVFDAIAIYNLIRMHPATVTTFNDALAASAASFVALAGDRVIVARHSQMMIHEAWGFAMGNAERMRAVAEFLDRQSDVVAGIYAERGETKEHWRALMSAETWFTAEEAVEAGLADEIGTSEAVQNRFDLSVFKNPPQTSEPPPPNEIPAVNQADQGALTQEALRYQHMRSRNLAGVS